MTDDQPSIARPTGCRCHIEAGDSVCPVHPPDPDELAYAASIGAPYLDVDIRPSIAELPTDDSCGPVMPCRNPCCSKPDGHPGSCDLCGCEP